MDGCPLCRQHREDARHVMKCNDDRARLFRITQFNALMTWMKEQHCDPLIEQCLCSVLLSDTPMTFTIAMSQISNDKNYLSAACEQDDIGLHNFFLGRITRLWKELQRAFYQRKFLPKRFSAFHSQNLSHHSQYLEEQM